MRGVLMVGRHRRWRPARSGMAVASAFAMAVMVGCGASLTAKDLSTLTQQDGSNAGPTTPAPLAGAGAPAPGSSGAGAAGSSSVPVAPTQPSTAGTAGVGQPAASGRSLAALPGGQNAGGQSVASHSGAACNNVPIVIGTVGTQSGVLGDVTRPLIRGVQAWVAAVDAAGGINCHKVQYLVDDDGGDPARHQALVRQLVENQGVVALVMMDAPVTSEASKDYLIQRHVPVVGMDGTEAFAYDSPVHFAPYPVGVPLFRLVAAAAARVTIPEGKRKAAVFGCELDACAQVMKVYMSYAPQLGYDIVWSGRGSISQPDFTAQCLQMKNAGADVILGGFDSSSYHRIAADCVKISYRPIIAAIHGNSDETWKDDPNMDGAVIGMPVQPWVVNDAAIREYQEAITRFLPGVHFNAGTIIGWTSAKVFERAARGVAPNATPSSATVLAGLKGIKGDDFGGLTPYPVDFSMPPPRPQIACGWPVVVHNGTFSADPSPFCAPQPGSQPNVVAADHPVSAEDAAGVDGDRPPTVTVRTASQRSGPG